MNFPPFMYPACYYPLSRRTAYNFRGIYRLEANRAWDTSDYSV